MEQSNEATSYQLTAEDRCDVCQAQAYVHVALEFGALMFCSHHWQENEAKLRPIATEIIDEVSRLLAR